ncbi:unnamed protein product [Ceutorhynchus assimilis]|uniref:Myb/SANT-like DNA-binding domain-containing protein n=1 Tax=Ceutorhynchus assimilis TaxID=467358 RepID=A0A9N9MNE7_9CUCU|nr:unnamed protein product [Ceutorhynchus assimilis]CAG9765827.1 unnamed protein product [Ceutorhynchus assimilis]
MDEDSENVEMVEFQLGNFIVNIDSETARMLCKDSQIAQNYLNELRRKYPEAEASTSSSSSNVAVASALDRADTIDSPAGIPQKIWTTSKNQTPLDVEAAAFFLSLRKELDDKFRDKKTTNATLWQQISEKMNANGYFVGHGIEGRERCRQKFANLQQTYLKYIDRRRQTGEGKIEKPPFFDEMDAILGKSDKTDPVLILDSIPIENPISNDVGSSVKSTMGEKSIDLHSSQQKKTEKVEGANILQNKFLNAKTTLKPKKNDFYEKFYDLSEKSEERKIKQFDNMMELMKDESQKRHEEVMAMLRIMAQKKPTKKRKRDSSSDTD